MENETRKREIDSDYVWKWLCRLVVLILIFYWLFNGLDPTERWIGLIVILLGLNEFSARKDKHGKGFSISVRQDKEVSRRDDNEGPSDPSLSIDWPAMVDWGGIRCQGA